MSFLKSKKNTNEQVDLIKWDKLLFSFRRSEDKQNTDSLCSDIRISGKIENQAKAYPKNAKHSVPETLRNVA